MQDEQFSIVMSKADFKKLIDDAISEHGSINKDLFILTDAAKYTGKSVVYLSELASTGKLTPYQVHKKMAFKKSDLDQLVQNEKEVQP